MRILAVRGCNLASLSGPFAVEFDDGPLRRAGLFAITGPTGAGKSTILDALCLALFDAMPRLPEGLGVLLGREGDPDAIRSNDVRAVLRRGAGSGWAEVDFLGIDGERYRARWEVRRAGQKARGRLQPQSISLSSLDGTKRFGDGKKSVLEEISRRLGLSFEQFRRAVLLAQGDFANFLKAPARERSALLELLTGTEIYSRISIAAHERCAAEQRALEALDAQCAGIGVLPDGERDDLTAEATTAAAAVREGERALETARAAVAWHERDALLAKAQAEAAAQADEAGRLWRAAEPRRRETALLRGLQPLRPLLAEADRCAAEAAEARDALGRAEAAVAAGHRAVEQATAHHAEVRRTFEAACAEQQSAEPALERAAALDEQIATLSAQHDEAAAEADTASERAAAHLGDWNRLEAALAAARRDAAERERWLAGQAPLAPVAEQWARWDAALLRHRDAAKAHAEAEAEARECGAQAKGHEAELTQLAEARGAAAALIEAAEAALAALRAEPVVPLEEISRRRATLTARRDLLGALARLAEEQGAAEAERARQATDATNADARAAEAKARHDRRQAVLEEAEGTLRRLHLAHREDVESLRAQLVPGESCPVCGSAEHPWAGGGRPLARLAGEQEERVAALRAEVTGLVTARAGHEAAAGAARARIGALDARLAALSEERAAVERRWAENTAEPAPGDVAGRLAEVEAELAEVAGAESLALDHKARLDAAERERRTREAKLAEAARAIEERTRRLDAARHAEALALAGRDRAARDMAGALDELAPPFAGLGGWHDALRADPEGFRAATAARAAAWLDQREAHARALREGEALAARSAAKAAELEAARHAEQAARRRAAALAERLGALRGERAGLLGGRAVAAVKRDLAEARQRAVALVDKATVARQDAAARLSAAEQERATRGETAQRCAEKAKDAAATLTAAAATAAVNDGRGVTVEEARRHLAARPASWLEAEEQALARLDTARREAELLAAERARLRAEHHAEGNTPAGGLDEARAAAAGAALSLEETRGRLGEVQARLRADAENRERLAAVLVQVESRRKAHALWAAMAQLIGSANGHKLRNFAQSLSLDMLLVHANRYLEDLARRYRLERVAGADLEIQVVDREMGDERRGVHSLSGGEMFLVSLALALGLSAMAGGGVASGGIGTLFIDEGFGTLDPDSLDLALSCLEALQATGRQVGVISHVPALVDRIGVQVRVTPLGGGRSTVAVLHAALGAGMGVGKGVEPGPGTDDVPAFPPMAAEAAG